MLRKSVLYGCLTFLILCLGLSFVVGSLQKTGAKVTATATPLAVALAPQAGEVPQASPEAPKSTATVPPPTATRTPKPTPTVTPTPEPMDGIDLMASLDSLGWRRELGKPVDGKPNRLYTEPRNLGLVQLIGEPFNLDKASMTVTVAGLSEDRLQRAGAYLTVFVHTLAPEAESHNYVVNGLASLRMGKPSYTAAWGGRKLTLTNYIDNLGQLILTIEAQE